MTEREKYIQEICITSRNYVAKLRDQFALAIIPAITQDKSLQEIAKKKAYEFADIILAERAK